MSTPSVGRDYNAKQFCVDVKTAFAAAGIRGEHVVFFLEDYQIVSESILEITNSLISSGEVPGLYTHEELETLLGPLRETMREDGGAFKTPYEFFISRIKKYLHIVISMDPGNAKFVYYCEANPALYSHCTVLWMGEFKNATLKLIPTLMPGVKELLGGGKSSESKEDTKSQDSYISEGKSSRKSSSESNQSSEELVDMVLGIHSTCVAPPRDFQVFLSTWHSLYKIKETEIRAQLSNLKNGLSKLDSATEIVNDLRSNASQSKIDLAVAQAAADQAMEDITHALSNATERRAEVTNISRTVAADREVTDAKKREIEDQLAEIQPILDGAKLAVGQIKPEHLNEIRSLTAPPEAIADVLAAVLMLLGESFIQYTTI